MAATSPPNKSSTARERAPLASENRTDEPRPWLTADDSAGWHARPRPQQPSNDSTPITVKQSILVELDATQLAWLDRCASQSGRTPAACVKELVERARIASEQQSPS